MQRRLPLADHRGHHAPAAAASLGAEPLRALGQVRALAREVAELSVEPALSHLQALGEAARERDHRAPACAAQLRGGAGGIHARERGLDQIHHLVGGQDLAIAPGLADVGVERLEGRQHRARLVAREGLVSRHPPEVDGLDLGVGALEPDAPGLGALHQQGQLHALPPLRLDDGRAHDARAVAIHRDRRDGCLRRRRGSHGDHGHTQQPERRRQVFHRNSNLRDKARVRNFATFVSVQRASAPPDLLTCGKCPCRTDGFPQPPVGMPSAHEFESPAPSAIVSAC
jgi:hypothetical protein